MYVLHAFEKRSRNTSARDLWIARQRLRLLVPQRGAPLKLRKTRSSGNVFRDVGFSPAEAEHLRVRAELMIALEKTLSRLGLKQSQAAAVLGVTQPRVSDLLRGRIDLFSVDTLIDMLARLGVGVRIVLKRSRRPVRVA